MLRHHNLIPPLLLLACLAVLAVISLPAAPVAARDAMQPVYLPVVANPAPPPVSSPIVYSNPVTYLAEKSVTVQNNNFDLDRLKVYQPLAISWESQTVVMNDIYPDPTSLGYDPLHGNGVLYWLSTTAPNPGQSKAFGEQFYVTVYAISTQINPAGLQPYDTSANLYQLYTRREHLLEADDDLVIQAAQAAAGSETNPYLQAGLIYDYVAAHLTYQSNNSVQGALATLQRGGGECGDYSAVFVAMCRAVGIPARPVVGFMATSGPNHHVWAEFYLQNIGWVPVDATFGDQGDTADDRYFASLDNQRIILTKNYNITLVPSAEKADLLQTYYWWYWGSGGGLQAQEAWTVSTP